MRRMYQGIGLVLVVILFACSSGSENVSGSSGDGGGTTEPPPANGTWSSASCGFISGTSYVGLSLDAGASIIDDGTTGIPSGSVFAFGLTRLGVDSLAALTNDQLLRSDDGGCNWSVAGVISSTDILRLSGAGAENLYAYGPNGNTLYHVDFDAGTINPRTTPGDGVNALWADPVNPQLIRLAVGSDHQIYDSNDGGQTYTAVGQSPLPNEINYFTAFNQGNPDHLLRGTLRLSGSTNNAGIWVSFDGGVAWQQSGGFQALRINGFTGTISEADPNIVWVLGLSVDDPSQGRRQIYRSADGGRNFTSVLVASDTVALTNATLLWGDPLRANRVTFSITDPPNVAQRRTVLHHYDFESDALISRVHTYEAQGEIRALVFNPDHEDAFFFTKTFQLVTKAGTRE